MITGFQKPCFQRTISTSGFPMSYVKMFCQHHNSLELLLVHWQLDSQSSQSLNIMAVWVCLLQKEWFEKTPNQHLPCGLAAWTLPCNWQGVCLTGYQDYQLGLCIAGLLEAPLPEVRSTKKGPTRCCICWSSVLTSAVSELFWTTVFYCNSACIIRVKTGSLIFGRLPWPRWLPFIWWIGEECSKATSTCWAAWYLVLCHCLSDI